MLDGFAAALLAVLAGLALVIHPSPVREVTQAANKRRAQRIAELEAGAPETYFEELRDLKGYPGPTNIRTWRLLGAGLLLLGAVMSYRALFRI